MMRHIVYLVPYLANCGPVNVLHGIMRHLDMARFRATVVALMPSGQAAERERFAACGARVVELSCTNWRLQLQTANVASLLLRRFGLDGHVIFHAHGYYPTRLLSKMRGARTMTTMHNICDEDFRMSKGRLLGGYMAHRYKAALKRLTVCIAISDGMEKYYAQNCDGRFETVYNGVEAAKRPTASERAAARRELGIAADAKALLYPAAFLPRKNHKALIGSIKQLDEANIVMLFAGSGETERHCKALAKGDGRFRFLGFCPDMERLWQAADFMVSPSLSEGLPMAVLEALTRGLPCILSDIPPHREIMRHVFGDDNLLFPLQETGSLTRLLRKAMHEELNQDEIAVHAANYYSSETMADGYMRLYEEM